MKLRTEAPVNGGRNYNGPKVNELASLSKIWLYAGKSEYPKLREVLRKKFMCFERARLQPCRKGHKTQGL